MQTAKISMDITKMISLVELYDSLANKSMHSELELQKTAAEMKAIKESILSLMIETKKGVRKIEFSTKP